MNSNSSAVAGRGCEAGGIVDVFGQPNCGGDRKGMTELLTDRIILCPNLYCHSTHSVPNQPVLIGSWKSSRHVNYPFQIAKDQPGTP